MQDEFDHPKLADALKRQAPTRDVPQHIDDAIVNGFPRRRRWSLPAAAAAAILLGASVWYANLPAEKPMLASRRVIEPIDVSAQATSPRPTILDALALARRGGAPGGAVDELARRSVQLEGF